LLITVFPGTICFFSNVLFTAFCNHHGKRFFTCLFLESMLNLRFLSKATKPAFLRIPNQKDCLRASHAG